MKLKMLLLTLFCAGLNFAAVAAPAPAPAPKPARKCPYCFGEVHDEATKCMHCGSDIPRE